MLVAQNDFSVQMNLEDAKKACRALGKGWRLPTINELRILYLNKIKIGGFVNKFYWSLSNFESVPYFSWFLDFAIGVQGVYN